VSARTISWPGFPPFPTDIQFLELTSEQLPVFIMLDRLKPSGDASAAPQPSILEEKTCTYVAGKKPVLTFAIDSFPFPYYLIVTDLTQLPLRLADALRQWFESGRVAL
jgi:midasin (ATPase involved in ribosome maturation)